jgi:hypothetical protein
MYLRIAFVLTVLISAPLNSLAQSRSGAAKSPLCTRENALEIIKQQVEVAKNFDTALSQSSGLTDKFQRAMSTLGLVDVCLNIRTEKPRSRKNAL